MDVSTQLEDYSSIETLINSKIHQTIKRRISSGISVKYDVCVGYDSEYESIDSLTNQLLSIQLCGTYRVLVSVPKPRSDFKFQEYNIGENEYYDITYLNNISEDINDLYYSKVDWFKMRNDINNSINYYREFNKPYWDFINGIHKVFYIYPSYVTGDWIRYTVYKGDNPLNFESLYTKTRYLQLQGINDRYFTIEWKITNSRHWLI